MVSILQAVGVEVAVSALASVPMSAAMTPTVLIVVWLSVLVVGGAEVVMLGEEPLVVDMLMVRLSMVEVVLLGAELLVVELLAVRLSVVRVAMEAQLWAVGVAIVAKQALVARRMT